MKPKMIFIVGLQKSGTTLFLRLLLHAGQIQNPFHSEGHDFWGNIPPLNPTGFPAGYIYQRSEGEMGHVINAEDASTEVLKILEGRIAQLELKHSVIVNKSPYNTVRLPWLRTLFPDAYIVGLIRRPVSNVFSLVKKYVPHKGRGSDPHDGWWGVKPQGWRNLVNEDKLIQSAYQWRDVNKKLWNDRSMVNRLILYHDLCSSPDEIVRDIFQEITKEKVNKDFNFPKLKNMDNEYLYGSRLLSKNKYFLKTNSFLIPNDEELEREPLAFDEIKIIKEICQPVVKKIGDML